MYMPSVSIVGILPVVVRLSVTPAVSLHRYDG
jgi:hypothetical protein